MGAFVAFVFSCENALATTVFQALETEPATFPSLGKTKRETFQCLEKVVVPVSNAWKTVAAKAFFTEENEANEGARVPAREKSSVPAFLISSFAPENL